MGYPKHQPLWETPLLWGSQGLFTGQSEAGGGAVDRRLHNPNWTQEVPSLRQACYRSYFN